MSPAPTQSEFVDAAGGGEAPKWRFLDLFIYFCFGTSSPLNGTAIHDHAHLPGGYGFVLLFVIDWANLNLS